MELKLSLPKNKVVWALAHPVSRGYIHESGGVGYQECQLIVSEKNQPVEATLEDFPPWARAQILTAIHKDHLINHGDPIPIKKPKEVKVQETSKEAEIEVVAEAEAPLEQPKKKRTRRKKEE